MQRTCITTHRAFMTELAASRSLKTSEKKHVPTWERINWWRVLKPATWRERLVRACERSRAKQLTAIAVRMAMTAQREIPEVTARAWEHTTGPRDCIADRCDYHPTAGESVTAKSARVPCAECDKAPAVAMKLRVDRECSVACMALPFWQCLAYPHRHGLSSRHGRDIS